MGKLTQKDLINEGFLDTMRALGKASAATAKALAPEIATPLSNIIEPFKKTIDTFKLNNPSSFVNDKLKKEYSNAFYKGSPRKFRAYKIPGEPRTGGRVGISFEAIRINPVDVKAGAAATPPKPETYYAILTRGADGWNMEVRDSQNRVIKGQKEKEGKKSTKPSWAEEIKNAGLPATPTFRDVKLWVLDYLPKEPARLRTIFGASNIDDVLQNLMSPASSIANTMQGKIFNDATPIDAADLEALKKGLITARIFSENSQLDTLKQLKIISESLNS